MSEKKKLNISERHILRLVRKGQDFEGWAKVSAQVWPFVKAMPRELVTAEKTETGGRAKLTVAGEVILDWT